MAIEIHQHSNRKYIFKWWIFHCYVSLPEGNVVFSALQIGTLRLGHLFLNNTGRMKFEELDSFGRRMNFPIDNISMYKFNTDITIYIYSIYTTYNIDTHTHTVWLWKHYSISLIDAGSCDRESAEKNLKIQTLEGIGLGWNSPPPGLCHFL